MMLAFKDVVIYWFTSSNPSVSYIAWLAKLLYKKYNFLIIRNFYYLKLLRFSRFSKIMITSNI